MINHDKEVLVSELKGSLLEFTKTFYPILTGRDFIISNPLGRESHFVTVARALTQAARLELPTHRLILNIPPGHGKSLLCCMWVAWTMASYPDSKYLYISYSRSLASKHTETIKRIINLAHYKFLFGVEIRHDSKAKEFFQTTAGGAVAAFGSSGSIVGTDAGLPGLSRFSGAVILDDAHKIDEAHSDTIREGVVENYRETLQQRARGVNVPFIYIGQRVHESDLAAYLLEGKDGYEWTNVILKSIDDAGNALYPEAFPLKMLRIKEERDPYVFSAQYQQEPVPAGGSLFKPEWFVLLEEDPEIIKTFIVCDTAETSSSYNDATVFSFIGIYNIEEMGKKTDVLGIHWIDCVEMRIEPKDLYSAFVEFYANCTTYKIPPLIAAIEKKSTGVTLVSTLKEFRGLQIREIDRTRASGSKAQRFLEIQPYVASKRVSFLSGAKHVSMCIDHMSKVTASDSHRWDDIADTLADAIKLALIEKTLYSITDKDNNREQMATAFNLQLKRKLQAGKVRNDPYSKKIR